MIRHVRPEPQVDGDVGPLVVPGSGAGAGSCDVVSRPAFNVTPASSCHIISGPDPMGAELSGAHRNSFVMAGLDPAINRRTSLAKSRDQARP